MAVAGLCAREAAAQRITVGPTVHISRDAAADPHGESFLAINPKNAKNLLAATNVVRKTGAGTSAYVSRDGGVSWSRVVLPASAANVGESWDVIGYFDPQGNAYYGGMYYGPAHKVNYGAGLWITRSGDEGSTWGAATLLPGGRLFDRPFMGFQSGARFAGRVYAGGVIGATGFDGKRHVVLAVAFSEDSAKNFGPPHLIASLAGEESSNLAGIVTTADGAVIVPFVTSAPRESAAGQRDFGLRVGTSSDGGNTYSISPRVLALGTRSPGIPSTVIDRAPGPFQGRIYIVWEERAEGGAGTNIRVAHSQDNGKSWSMPVTVNDDSPAASHVNPAIAVSGDGIVGVTWNDRRGQTGKCYRLYFSASLDGGDTFLPNVTAGGAPTCPRSPSDPFPDGGETQGLAGGVGGLFHAAWIDGSSGVTQLVTTPFSVLRTGGRESQR